MKYVFGMSSFFSIVAVFSIIIYILGASIPAFREIGVIQFIFGMMWDPTENQFGIFPMIVGTLQVSLGAVCIGGVLGFFTAVFIAKFCPPRIRNIVDQLIKLLAGIPSIVYGFFGMLVIVPALKSISPNGIGEGVLACSIILGIMILPTIVSLSKTGLDAVPKEYFEGAIAMGATKEQAVFRVVVPAAKSSIITSIVLGLGRAVGETMAVIMVAGNSPYIASGLFGYMRTLTINVMLEMGYSEGLHRQALIATSFILLVLVLLINAMLNLLKNVLAKERKSQRKLTINENRVTALPLHHRAGIGAKICKICGIVSAVVSVFALLYITGFILIKGIPYIDMNMLFGKSGNRQVTLAPAFVVTGVLIVISLLIALPLGIFAAIYLVEYAKKGSKFVKVIRIFTETLSGIPSIVFGLFGMIVFCESLHLGYCVLAGALTLAIIIFPTIIRSTEEALMSVPDGYREGSLALGANKVRTIFKVVIPSALPGILAAVVLSIGRIVGESAALIYTTGMVPYMPKKLTSMGSSFAVMMKMFASEGLYIEQAYATAAVLLLIVLALNIVIALIEKRLQRKRGNQKV